MLVEDDNNLREIYGARLLAEGFEIVSAKDGEEALAMAVKERPDLIISDIMMPKISGFDMLDILRSTPETKNTKVIMMTALSQSEDKERADKLGADRYLVKSQVTLEDVAKAAKEVLAGDTPTATGTSTPTPGIVTPTAAPGTATPVQAAEQVNTQIEGASNISTVEVGVPATASPVTPVMPVATVPTPPVAVAATPVAIPVATPAPSPVTPTAAPTVAPTAVTPGPSNSQVLANALAAVTPDVNPSSTATDVPSGERVNTITPGDHAKTSVHTRVINPINDLSEPGNKLQELLAKEESQVATSSATPILPVATPAVPTVPGAVATTPVTPTVPGAVVSEVMQIESDIPPTTANPIPPPAPLV